jgi:hypothetical protein
MISWTLSTYAAFHSVSTFQRRLRLGPRQEKSVLDHQLQHAEVIDDAKRK